MALLIYLNGASKVQLAKFHNHFVYFPSNLDQFLNNSLQ